MSTKHKKAEKQSSATESEEEVLDVYESWLEKQPVKSVKGRSGFIAEQRIEEAEADSTA